MEKMTQFLKLVNKEFPGILNPNTNIDRVPVKLCELSFITGGGIPLGRILEIYGPESTGKSALASYIAKQFMNVNLPVVYLDFEQGFDIDFAERVIGVDTSNPSWVFIQPQTAEEGFNIIDSHIESALGGLIIIDSVASMPTRQELEADTTDAQIGILARTLSKGCKRIVSGLSKTNATLLFINQTRSGIGMYAPSLVTPGGNAIKFYSSIRIEVRRKDFIGGIENPKGIAIRLKTVKNKTFPPLKIKIAKLYFDKGFDEESGWTELFLEQGVLLQSGAWFEFNSALFESLPEELVGKKFNGLAKVSDYLQNENPSFLNSLKNYYLKLNDVDSSKDTAGNIPE